MRSLLEEGLSLLLLAAFAVKMMASFSKEDSCGLGLGLLGPVLYSVSLQSCEDLG